MIGQVRAQAIVDHRKLHGPFTAVEKLLEVKGIGPATLTGIRNRVEAGTECMRLKRTSRCACEIAHTLGASMACKGWASKR